MNSNIINFNLIDESQELKVELLDDNNEINFTMTDYDDSEIKDEISNIETQVNTNTTKIAQNKADIQALDDRVDQIPIVTKTSQLTNDSGYITEDYHDDTKQNKLVSGQNIKTINNESILGSGNLDIEGVTDYEALDNLPSINNVTLKGNKTSNDLGLQPAGNYATSQELTNESTARENADNGLQNQIDAITASTDVKDIVGTYQELLNYPTSTLGNDDIIKVLQDSTHSNAMSYYRWVITAGVGSWVYIGSEGPFYTKSEADTLLNTKQNEITSSNKLLSDLVDDTNQTNKFVTASEKTTWNGKADAGFTGIITGTSANPTDGASLPVGVYKASESQNTSYINLIMEDGTTKRQSVQKGGIVIRTTARLEIFATQNLMYQYDTTNEYFYPAESFIESNLRRDYEAEGGYASLGTVSPPNNIFITSPINTLEATINTGEIGHSRIIFSVEDGIAKGDFGLSLTDADGNDLIFNNGALPKPVAGESWIFDFVGNRCNATLYKSTYLDRDRDEQILFLVRSNSDQIYYPNLDSKPSITVQSAKGSTDPGRPVVMEYSEPFLTSFQNVEYYGIPQFIPLDLSIYNTSTQANMLHPHSQLPDGNYWVKYPGRMWIAGESYMLVGKELIYKKGDILGINGGEYTAAYYSWDSTEDDYKGGFFTTYQDVTDAISEINYEPALTVVRQTTVSGTTTVNNGKWNKRTNPVNSMTLAMANLTEIPDTFKARVTAQTSATFTSFNISQRTAFKVYFAGWDCTNGVLAGKPNAFYNIDYRADGRGNIIAMVTGYDVPSS